MAAPERHSPWRHERGVVESRADHRRGEVVVVGAGLTGLLTALRLAEVGRDVLVLEAGSVGDGETLATTAHVTGVLDSRFAALSATVGDDNARLVLEGQALALTHLFAIAQSIGPSAGLAVRTGYLYADASDADKQRDALGRERESATRLGIEAGFMDSPPLPFATCGAMTFANQLALDAGGFLAGLRHLAEKAGVRVAEGVSVTAVKGAHPVTLETLLGPVTAGDVVLATHVPVHTRFAFHTKLEAFRSYALAAPLTKRWPALEVGLFWDLAEPYHYIRSAEIDGTVHLIVGGEDHRVGTGDDTHANAAALERYFTSRFSSLCGPVTHAWSGQIIETMDGIPLIGRQAAHGDGMHLYLATGYAGNGFTHAALAAHVISEQIQGRTTPWDALMRPGRLPLNALGRYAANNAETVGHIVSDIVRPGADVAAIARGEGAIVNRRGSALAVYRDHRGTLNCHSARCPHLGCTVAWNAAEASWDCPCHGSRFTHEGRVINGPATTDLKPEILGDDDPDPVPFPIA